MAARESRAERGTDIQRHSAFLEEMSPRSQHSPVVEPRMGEWCNLLFIGGGLKRQSCGLLRDGRKAAIIIFSGPATNLIGEAEPPGPRAEQFFTVRSSRRV